MNPSIPECELKFDSCFESGNLDMVIQTKPREYDLYMRVDTNTRGHHQWFYFSIEYGAAPLAKTVRFNIVNFTKKHSLYSQGMQVCVSKRGGGYKWGKGGHDIKYSLSRVVKKRIQSVKRYYNQLSFSFDLDPQGDKVYFAYCYPYTYSNLYAFLRSSELQSKDEFCKEEQFCSALSGLDVPMLTVTSRVNEEDFDRVLLSEFDDELSSLSVPVYRRKKYVVMCGRVHPGESVGSWMMQGFIKFILSDTFAAQQLRKRCVFKIIPMINPDGVIIGNYRTSLAGNDLNRKYYEPDPQLHPTVCAMKALINQI